MQVLTIRVKDIDKALNKIKELSKVDRKQARRFQAGIKRSAKPMIEAVKNSVKPSRRSGRVTKTITTRESKDPSKKRTKDVTYRSGNLKRSIGFIPPKKRGSLYGSVGARMGKKAGKTFDGYYAAIVNYGERRGKSRAKVKERRNVNYSIKGYNKAKTETQKQMQKQVSIILNNSISKLARM